MKEYTVVNILDMLEAIGEENLSVILSDFSCPINKEIENFVWYKAIEFAKKKMSITYFLMDAKGEIAAIFTLTHKAVEIGNADISSTIRRKLSRYAQLDGNTNSYTVSAFLIAQFGKNYGFKGNLELSGNALMDDAFEILGRVQRDIGGGIVYLECEDRPKLLEFYQSDKNRFKIFGERFSEVDQTRYIQLLKLF